jgi:hypothetical protein
MLRKPLSFGLLVVVLAVGALFWGRSQWRESRESVASKSKKQTKASQGVPEEEQVMAPVPEPPPKVTMLSVEARAHLAEKAFISGLRAAFLWLSGQPQTEKTHGEWLGKLIAIPSDDLPAERRQAWRSLLEAWRALADPASSRDPALLETGRQAAVVLNDMLKEHGDGDIQF